ncbi:MAG: hypothetical protein HRT35_35135, partial [Algicola sp.]|nr:hypothetical protein [Algicola sp.]
ELLRYLAAVTPSKILISSRLIPQVLLNQARQTIPGVLRERLAGLRPPDAEALIRACGITGCSEKIQNYLHQHCDCHPLVIGALAGLVNDYLPNRGHFDDWQNASSGGGNLNLAELDLVQKRNHILTAAMAALDDHSKQLLSTLALLSEAIDFDTLSAFNPYLPPASAQIEKPQSDTLRQLQTIISNLEKRGLLQYDHQSKSYDLHPVVRGIAAGALQQADKERFGTLVVDHFASQSHNPYEEAKTLDDVSHGLHIVRTFIQMGQLEKAFEAFNGDLHHALMFNLNAHVETLAILRAFCPNGWHKPANIEGNENKVDLFNIVACELDNIGEPASAMNVFNAAIAFATKNEQWSVVSRLLCNLSLCLVCLNRLASQSHCLLLALELRTVVEGQSQLFSSRFYIFDQLSLTGQWQQAETIWPLFYPLCAQQSRSAYRLGGAEHDYAYFLFYQNKLTNTYLSQTEQLANEGRDRGIIKDVHHLRGHWNLKQEQYELAIDSLTEAVRMAHEVGESAAGAEAKLALARFHLDFLPQPKQEAQRLAEAKDADHLSLAELWLAIGDSDQAIKEALAAYKWAWADGEPYVRRWELNQAKALLQKLATPEPDLPDYDPTTAEKFPWQDALEAAIEKLREEKEAAG